jgi:Kef-type K+ transport system membrane component KefB
MVPEVYAFLLPPSVAPFLQVICQVGVVLYMFLVGLEPNPIIGLDLGVISSTLFAMLVILAFVTTFATAPILDWITDSGRGTSTLSADSVPS